MSERNDIEHMAYNYGQFVAQRENASHGNGKRFEELDKICMKYWHSLIEAGAYADDENSRFKDEYRQHYYDGMNQIPVYRWRR